MESYQHKLVVCRDSEGVTLKPSIVIEVSFFEVLKSKEFKLGYSLRDPYFNTVRDKSVSDISTLNDVLRIYSNKSEVK